MSHLDPLILIGGGGHALVVADSARAAFNIVGFLDDDLDAPLGRAPSPVLYVGKIAELARVADRPWILAVGHIPFRGQLIDRLAQMEIALAARTVVHPTAIVSPSARIGRGVFIGPGAIVNARALIMDHAIINTGAIVEHECTVGFNTHIAPGAVLAGRVRVGAHTLIGVGSRILPNLSIGDRAIVGAGSVVTKSVVDEQTVVGVPAKSAVNA